MSHASRYLKIQTDSIDKWRQFNAQLEQGSFFKSDSLALAEFTKEMAASKFLNLNPEQQKKLAICFLKFGCEALMVFEQCFMYAHRVIRKKNWDPEQKKAFDLFVKEEFYHTKAFRKYLISEALFDFPKQSTILRKSRWLKNTFAWILKREPFAIILPGAKSEVFSLYMTQYMEKFFPAKNFTYSELHRIHSLDEAYHVAIDYELVQKYFENKTFLRKAKFIFFNYVLIFFIQFIVICGFNNAAEQIFHRPSKLFKARFIFQLFRWTLWNFQPYSKTKVHLKNVYKNQKDFYIRAVGAIITL